MVDESYAPTCLYASFLRPCLPLAIRRWNSNSMKDMSNSIPELAVLPPELLRNIGGYLIKLKDLSSVSRQSIALSASTFSHALSCLAN